MASKKISKDELEVEYFKANDLHKNHCVVLRGSFPCKIVETDWSAPGKHGAAKIRVIGVDLFTDKKYDDIFGSGDQVMVPIVKKTDYQVQFLDEDKYMKLISNDGKIRDDMKLNPNDELSAKIEEMQEQVEAEEQGECKAVVITVMSAMNQERICAAKIETLRLSKSYN